MMSSKCDVSLSVLTSKVATIHALLEAWPPPRPLASHEFRRTGASPWTSKFTNPSNNLPEI